jgi:TonB family protein
MKFFVYLLEASVCLTVWYLFYRLMLHRETHFGWNRLFIGLAVLSSLIIPALDIRLQPDTLPGQSSVLYEFTLAPVLVEKPQHIFWLNVLRYGYWAGVGVFACRLLFQIIHLIRFAYQRPSTRHGSYRLILTGGHFPTFSFFRLLFWNDAQNLPEANREQILTHELAHIRAGHSLDVLLMEVLKIVFWFNPIVYLWKNTLQEVHEYLADAAVTRKYVPDTYIQLMVKQALQQSNLSFASSFNQSAIKKRIAMIQKTETARAAIWKFAFSLPIIAVLVFLYACSEEKSVAEPVAGSRAKSANSEEVFMVVEDQPSPVGGTEAFYKFIAENLKYPDQARRMGIEGRVFAQFIVDTDGTLTDVQILKGIGAGCDEEVVKLLQRAPKWSPGRQKGEAVRVQMSVPVVFKLD